MKYVSIDIETTGLNPDDCQIISIGAVIEDTELKLPFDDCPKFHAIILHDRIIGEPYALNMNRKIITWGNDYMDFIKSGDTKGADNLSFGLGVDFCREDDVVRRFVYFLEANGIVDPKCVTINVAGKNFSTFDKKFLDKLPGWNKSIRTRQRVLDPAILFMDWSNDDKLPTLGMCKERAGIDGEVTHVALDDAWDVIQVLRTQY